jgi:hypothetical protein
MKHNFFVLVFLCALAFSSYSQSPEASFVSSISNDTKMNFIKADISLSEWHEQSFWAQYSNYLGKVQSVSALTYGALQKLALPTNNKTEDNVFEDVCTLFAYRFNELAIKREYFVEISHEHNGLIGLQFLQTEMMFDMMECVQIYDASSLQKFRFLPKAFSGAKLKQAKYNTITRALSLTPKEATLFFPLYSRYEQECEDLMGEQYDLYELFSIDATDLTPAICKNHGFNLLTLMDREIKLKEKYFTEMSNVVGSSLAARFFSWEDYYSIMCKMYIWAHTR